MAKRLLALCIALATFLPAASAQAGFAPARLLFFLKDARINESSGVAAYSRSSKVLFTHNDSGDTPRFFAIGPRGQTLATYDVVGAGAADWEDMATSGRTLFFGDIGDNFHARPFVTVYSVPEPVVDLKHSGISAAVQQTFARMLVYEDGPHDAETLLFIQKTRAIGIVTKEPDGRSGVYIEQNMSAAGLDPLFGIGVAVLHRIATIDLSKIARPYQESDFDPTSRLLATAGEISRDGHRLVVRTYVEAFEWDISRGLARGLKTAPVRIKLPRTSQGEAVAYAHDDRSLVTTSELSPTPVHLVPST